MNKLCSFRLCKLTDSQLILSVDKSIDKIYEDGKIPGRHLPARPDEDFDLLIGELLIRFDILSKKQSNYLFTKP